MNPAPRAGDSFVDLHCHILPGIDDGPADFAGSTALLEAAWSAGSRKMVATPHMFQEGLGSADTAEVGEHFEDFVARIDALRRRSGEDYLADLELFLGAENYVGEAFLEALAGGDVLPLAGSSYLLLEFWPAITRAAAQRAIGAVQDAGFSPVLAHVERYAFLQEEPRGLADLVTAGCVAQVNSSAVLGLQGLRPAQLTDRWLREGSIALVASDGHDVSRRHPELATVAEHLRSRHGLEAAATCLRRNPQAILDDEPVTLPEPRRSPWWRRTR